MIILIKALDLKVGMVVSTDSMQITQLVDYRGLLGKIYVGGICHGIYKEALFNPDETLPIYFEGREN
jgi:hypothetical protein